MKEVIKRRKEKKKRVIDGLQPLLMKLLVHEMKKGNLALIYCYQHVDCQQILRFYLWFKFGMNMSKWTFFFYFFFYVCLPTRVYFELSGRSYPWNSNVKGKIIPPILHCRTHYIAKMFFSHYGFEWRALQCVSKWAPLQLWEQVKLHLPKYIIVHVGYD